MIDTIKLAYPLDNRLLALLDGCAERLQKLSPDGEILWEKSIVRGDVMPSHYSGLRISIRRVNELYSFLNEDQSRNIGDLAFFEFSLQKWQSPSAYNNRNTTIATDMLALHEWILTLSRALEYEFDPEGFRLYRVDLSQNFLLKHGKPADYIRCLEITFSRHPTADNRLERTGYAVYQRSSWLGKKLYYKGQEFLDVERKKHKTIYTDRYCANELTESETYTPDQLQPLTPTEINELMSMVRFEVEFKRDYFQRYKMATIHMIPKLVERFNQEKNKYINIPLIARGEVQGEFALSPSEYFIIELVRVHGLKRAKEVYLLKKSERSWYHHQRQLAGRGIHLSALDNSKYRYSEEERFINPEQKDYQLELAPFQEDYLQMAA
ncbi:hypothetical protein [Trichlorobacter ammonificans]|uniref:Uncharacterized protein n=1 Tax=Trichlorobacter ammonificans TaxID=2916410 RepID=A0ABM9DA56_9BACT|nr:hypothetical protein [Trichlorobacter ammonificans]CAH2032099.1 protein of unknown function [Trichlorobacter ammonificans]